MDKPYIFTSDTGDIVLEWVKQGARFSLFFGYEGSTTTDEDFGWIYVDKSGEMQSGKLPEDIYKAITLFLNYKE